MTDLNNLANANAVNPELDAKVDDLSKPGNEEALNKALTDEMSQNEDPAQNDLAPKTDVDPADTKNADDKSDDPLKDQDPDKDPKEQKVERSKKLLHDRNEAREAAAKAELDSQAKEKKISDLEAENARLRSDDKGDGDDDPSADKNDGDNDLQKRIDEGVKKALGDRDNASAAEKSDVAEVEALRKNNDTPDSEKYETEINDVMKKHPTVSAYAAYRMLQGEGVIPTDTASPGSNANKLNTGDQPKNNLIKEKNPKDMTTAEQEAHLRGEQAAGRLTL